MAPRNAWLLCHGAVEWVLCSSPFFQPYPKWQLLERSWHLNLPCDVSVQYVVSILLPTLNVLTSVTVSPIFCGPSGYSRCVRSTYLTCPVWICHWLGLSGLNTFKAIKCPRPTFSPSCRWSLPLFMAVAFLFFSFSVCSSLIKKCFCDLLSLCPQESHGWKQHLFSCLSKEFTKGWSRMLLMRSRADTKSYSFWPLMPCSSLVPKTVPTHKLT